MSWKRPRFNSKTKAVFEKAEVKEYKAKIIEAFEESGGKVYERDVPLRMSVVVYMRVPRSASFKKQIDLIENHRPTKRPDTDNFYKVIADALNGIAYYDDSQIVSTYITKFWSSDPRVEITIREVGDYE